LSKLRGTVSDTVMYDEITSPLQEQGTHFWLMTITEFTSILELMCEWSVTGQKPERCVLSEQHICEFAGKAILAILG